MEISSSAPPAVTAERAMMFVAALELSKSTWLVVLHSPVPDKVSQYRLAGGDVTGLLALIARKQVEAETRLDQGSGFYAATRKAMTASGRTACCAPAASTTGYWMPPAFLSTGGRAAPRPIG